MASVSVINNLRDRWERMNPRERKLMLALGITFVICIFGWLGFTAKDYMGAIEAKNDASRKALRALAQHRAGAAQQASRKQVEIPASPVSLDSYLEDIVNELGLESPTYPAPKSAEKGEFDEWSFKVELKELSIYEVKDFLERVETKSDVVVIKELRLKQNFRKDDKLDLEVIVATYSKKQGDESDGEGEES